MSILTRTDLPLIIELPDLDPAGFTSYYLQNQKELDLQLSEVGAIKFKGVSIDSLQAFQDIVNSISSKFLRYIDGNSPRTRLSGNVYTSTEYDKTQRITMHNELSYSAKWPNKLFFSCLQVASNGGETLLADSREIFKRMDKAIVEEVMARGVLYIRNLHGGRGVGPSWQHTFETEDRHLLEEYCRSYSIDFEWRENNNLRLTQPSRGIIRHRQSGEWVWFNQIDQFHPFQLGEELFNAMQSIYDSPEDFPMYVSFGDGKAIEEDIIRAILDTIAELTIFPPWEKNELLLVDNERVSHGRNSFSGQREVLVAMSE